jgi:pimeloyl-ACP methyl ester carboxylesterase
MNPIPCPTSKPIIPFTEAPHPREERGIASGPYKYIATSLAVGALAAIIFAEWLPIAVGLIAISAWLMWSGIIILLNRAVDGKHYAKPIHQLHSVAMEFNSGIVAAVLFLFTHFKRYHKPKGNLAGRPILLVNGYLSFGSIWQYIRKELVKNGFGPIYTMNIGSGKSIMTYATEVQKKVKEIQIETGRNDIAFVGHSKGGLVSSFFAADLANETGAQVTDVVTIGSPLSGTPVAYIGIGRDAHEMRSDSEFHRYLRDRMELINTTRFFHAASETDEIVPHASSLIGKMAERHLLLKDTGHLSLVFSSRIADQVGKWLYCAHPKSVNLPASDGH